MNYHIGTMLIDENFDDSHECPVCRIKRTVDRRLTEQYLGEGVMEDDTRAEVNALGFCVHHFNLLYSMPSKLGLALQASTRLASVVGDFAIETNPKRAKKNADKILEKQKTCVVCKYLDSHLVRYYKTIAEVYASREEFRKRIEVCHGFCAEHYAQLLRYSSYASIKTKDYLAALGRAQQKRLSELSENLVKFCNRHDYRNARQPLGNEKAALKDYSDTFYGSDV